MKLHLKYPLFILLHIVVIIHSDSSNNDETISSTTSTTDTNTEDDDEHESHSSQKEQERINILNNTTTYQFESNPQYQEEQNNDKKEVTLLDLFGENAKELLTKHMIPDTNIECQWNWNQFRCEPLCNCAVLYKVGDYHLGRSCRLKQQQQQQHSNNIMEWPYKEKSECEAEWIESNSIPAKSVRFISNRLDKFDASKVTNRVGGLWTQGTTMVRERVCTLVEDKEIEFMYDFCVIEDDV